MTDPVQERWIEDGLGEVDELGPKTVTPGNDLESGRGLLPGIGHHDPDGAEVGPQADKHGRQEVSPGLDPVPAEQEDGQETGLQEEGEDALGRQGAAEHVAHEPGVGGPVGPELEFQDDATGHAEGEDQALPFRAAVEKEPARDQ